MSSGTVAIVAVLGVAAVVGVVLFVQSRKPRELSSGDKIGAGLGMLVGGIIGAATE